MPLLRDRNPILQLRKKWFPNREDRVWQEWLELERREQRHLIELVNDPSIRDTYKARALIILFAPDLRRLPIDWTETNYFDGSYLRNSRLDLESLNTTLLGLVAELLGYAEEFLLSQTPDRNRDEKLAGVNYYWIQLFKLTPLADQFPIWQHINLEGWCHGEFAPWYTIIQDPDISMHWKLEADKEIRIAVLRELADDANQSSNALRSYLRGVSYTTARDQLTYDTDLLAHQIEFFVSLEKPDVVGNYVMQHELPRLLNHLADVKYRRVWRLLIRYLLTCPEYHFGVYSSQNLQLAEDLLKVMEGDEEIIRILQEHIEEGKENIRQREIQKKAKQQRVASVLRQMRV